ncbi:MAG: nicotinate phosphoribosyltransferase [Dehalococcoidia bacterium]|jgi:nicotinate phosphoribosyltransferase|nr:nicotinate phosphoribosyltransferase [Dehalococcoidia bacterium]
MPRYEPSDALYVDLYQLTMAQAYLRSGHTDEATFSLFVRTLPPDRGYLLFAGLEDVLRYLEKLRFTPGDLDYLRSAGQFGDDLIDYLAGIRFTGSVRAMAEGTPFFANEPVIEVTAPVIESQLVETFLINQVNMQSLFATKAARVVQAADGAGVADFASRRTHGTDAGNKFARASYLGGFIGTSNVGAGALYGIPTIGTMAHSFITSFGTEIAAFRAYASAFPDSTTLLVDTYDTGKGIEAAITVAHEMESRGRRMAGIRLDSGDLGALSRIARQMLDDAGLSYVQIVASGGLDEFSIAALAKAGAPIGAYGVGTKAGVSADAPWSDAAYKQVTYAGKPVAKFSSGKATFPGAKQVWRCFDEGDEKVSHDHLTSAIADAPERNAVPLLSEVMRDGKRISELPPLEQVRERVRVELGRLPASGLALSGPTEFQVFVSGELAD